MGCRCLSCGGFGSGRTRNSCGNEYERRTAARRNPKIEIAYEKAFRRKRDAYESVCVRSIGRRDRRRRTCSHDGRGQSACLYEKMDAGGDQGHSRRGVGRVGADGRKAGRVCGRGGRRRVGRAYRGSQYHAARAADRRRGEDTRDCGGRDRGRKGRGGCVYVGRGGRADRNALFGCEGMHDSRNI